MGSDAAIALERPCPPTFSQAFRANFRCLLQWRRDVRRFVPDPIDDQIIEELLDIAQYTPSVGNSQPWRWVDVTDRDRRASIRDNFSLCNAKALSGYKGPKAELYAKLKLAGLDVAPRQLAVFCDDGTEQGSGLGRRTMPETLHYSAAMSIHTFWLAARMYGIGLGWISILDPDEVRTILDVPERWQFIGYLCVGYPVEDHLDPELERAGWQARTSTGRKIIQR